MRKKARISAIPWPGRPGDRRGAARWTVQGDGLSFRELCLVGAPASPAIVTLREARIDALVKLLPFTMGVTILNAALVFGSLYLFIPLGELALWFGATLLLGLVRVTGAVRSNRRGEALPLWSLMAGASLSAALWAVPSLLWFHSVPDAQQLLIVIVLMGMMSGASSSLATVPPTAVAAVTIYTITMFTLEMHLGLPLLAVTALAFGLTLCFSSFSQARQFVGHAAARIELREQAEMIELLREFDATGSGWLWELDGELNLIYMSRDMAEASGRPLPRALGMTARQLLDPSGRISALSAGMRSVFQHFDDLEPFRDIAVPTTNGRWWCLSGKPVLDPNGRCLGWRGVGSDITEVRRSGSNSVRAARHDPLTGLANRLMVREQLEEALLRQEAGAGACSLLLVDLDRFKLVNDTLGHATGDQLLRHVARRLEQCIDDDASVGRLGGDEFAILWFGAREDSALAELSQMVVGRLAEPFFIAGSELTIGATIGIASSPRDGCTQDELTRSADLALYRAKEAGRGSFQFFDSMMIDEARSKRQLESDLRSALHEGELTLAYQPFVDARTGDIVGREALLRWNHPERGEIPPDLFVPVIEDVGLIGQVGSWVIRRACAEAASWPGELRLAVNVSAAQLTGSALATTVVGALASSGLSAERLELEITETNVLRDDQATVDALEGLRRLGVKLVLDDFGTGYSSFGYLARARFHKIKIDKSFVHAASEGSRQAAAIVESIIALAHGLSLEITAEGVESAQQAALMRVMGCDLLQGFYFGRPAAAMPRGAAGADHPPALQRKRA